MGKSNPRDDSSIMSEVSQNQTKHHHRTRSAVGAAKSLLRGSHHSLSAANLTVPQMPALSKSVSASSDMPAIPASPSELADSSSTSGSAFAPPLASSAASAVNVNNPAGSVDDAVSLLNIVNLVRRGDKAAIDQLMNSPNSDVPVSQKQAVLGIAAVCASPSIVQYVLGFYTKDRPWLDINTRDSDGNTVLHLATKNNRSSIVKMLLERVDINDTVTNNDGLTPLDLDCNEEIKDSLSKTRLAFSRSAIVLIRNHVAEHRYDDLGTVLAYPRIHASIDLSDPGLVSDPDTVASSGTLLHEAARKGDKTLIQILLKAGADPFVRDKKGKGKRPAELNRRDSIKSLFKAARARDSLTMAAGETPLESKESRELRGYLKKWTNYRTGYRLRWFVLENGVLSYYKSNTDTGSACRGAINMRIAVLRIDSHDKFRFQITGPEKSSVKYHLKAETEEQAKRWIWVLTAAIRWAKDQDQEQQKRADRVAAAANAAAATSTVDVGSLSVREGSVTSSLSKKQTESEPGSADFVDAQASRIASRATVHSPDVGISDDEDDDDRSFSDHDPQATLLDNFTRNIQSARIELQLMSNLSRTFQASGANTPGSDYARALNAYDTSISSLRDSMEVLESIYADNDHAWTMQMNLWQEMLAKYAREQETLLAEMDVSKVKRRQQGKLLRSIIEGGAALTRPDAGVVPIRRSDDLGTADDPSQAAAAGTTAGTANNRAELPRQPTIVDPSLFDSESDGEDEFFDAVNDGSVEAIATPAAAEADAAKLDESVGTDVNKAIVASFRGYEDPVRTHLKLDKDNRPKISLWGILKSMIGKDMTKMTLPVSFNEPTSLLHRVAEDMEYADLLDEAVKQESSTKRMLYVAAFAASEYASTIGRIAKPFNPLLAETFEYARPDKGYRFLVEQVSHHPPISAAYADSDRWEYWGESRVNSKFYGRSFDINPLGTWFLRLRPKNGPPELYTWKKVTSSVVGIIIGNPTVENYGTMMIENHNTGDLGKVEFLQRGWGLSSTPYRVDGQVFDKSKTPIWDLSGSWKSQLAYKPARADPSKGTIIWSAHPRPAEMPFNLTSFAVTFNALPDKLRPLLAPTDSRFRPDQRAMEEGEYDLAATEKDRLENAQRRRKSQRDASNGTFVPRWFSKSTCKVTSEPYWEFNGDYWKVRDRVAAGEIGWDEQKLEEIFPPLEM